MLTDSDRLILDAVRKASELTIKMGGAISELIVRDKKFSRDVALALQDYMNRHEKHI